MFSIFQAKTVHFFSISNQNSQNLYPIYEKKKPGEEPYESLFWEPFLLGAPKRNSVLQFLHEYWVIT